MVDYCEQLVQTLPHLDREGQEITIGEAGEVNSISTAQILELIKFRKENFTALCKIVLLFNDITKIGINFEFNECLSKYNICDENLTDKIVVRRLLKVYSCLQTDLSSDSNAYGSLGFGTSDTFETVLTGWVDPQNTNSLLKDLLKYMDHYSPYENPELDNEVTFIERESFFEAWSYEPSEVDKLYIPFNSVGSFLSSEYHIEKRKKKLVGNQWSSFQNSQSISLFQQIQRSIILKKLKPSIRTQGYYYNLRGKNNDSQAFVEITTDLKFLKEDNVESYGRADNSWFRENIPDLSELPRDIKYNESKTFFPTVIKITLKDKKWPSWLHDLCFDAAHPSLTEDFVPSEGGYTPSTNSETSSKDGSPTISRANSSTSITISLPNKVLGGKHEKPLRRFPESGLYRSSSESAYFFSHFNTSLASNLNTDQTKSEPFAKEGIEWAPILNIDSNNNAKESWVRMKSNNEFIDIMRYSKVRGLTSCRQNSLPLFSGYGFSQASNSKLGLFSGIFSKDLKHKNLNISSMGNPLSENSPLLPTTNIQIDTIDSQNETGETGSTSTAINSSRWLTFKRTIIICWLT
ncbi:Vacuolar transporter chaperone 4 [Smittium culicis]|uniref:Vacuolar transporter chaperone 4 n=1 Tax=Smittium culicis TaxID=133412 RepID=A0A1R1YQ10_9FUNG|nr:Vacuolar transporter chaperone 4 [Smittium culicis]